MGFIIAAAIGGFIFGGLAFVGIGVAWGYATAVKHLSAAGAMVLQNAAASQKPQQPVVVSSNSTSTRFHN
jgi:hypothetical protein